MVDAKSRTASHHDVLSESSTDSFVRALGWVFVTAKALKGKEVSLRE
jgi:hypothetical protein